MKSKLLKYNGIGALCSSTDCSWVEGPIYNLRDFYYKYRHGSLLGMHTHTTGGVEAAASSSRGSCNSGMKEESSNHREVADKRGTEEGFSIGVL